jgi:hypothetical protein
MKTARSGRAEFASNSNLLFAPVDCVVSYQPDLPIPLTALPAK